MVFPFFIMCIYLLPLYYTVTKLAEERESRAREGMKMMGLKDKTYFIAWFIFYACIIAFMSTILICTASIKIFLKSNKALIFAMLVGYGLSLFGFAFTIVAFFPSKKSSATVASIVHILSYYFGIANQGYNVSMSKKILVALIPNASLCFMVEHLLQCEYLGRGLTVDQASM